MDMTSLLLLVFAALGIISSNTPVTVAMVFLLLLRVLNVNQAFPWLEKYGLTLGIIILTIGVMAPCQRQDESADDRGVFPSLEIAACHRCGLTGGLSGWTGRYAHEHAANRCCWVTYWNRTWGCPIQRSPCRTTDCGRDTIPAARQILIEVGT